jgi:flagellar protein FliS
MKNPALAYRQFSVQSATPLGLVVMLYDGAIAAMERAAVAMETHNISGKCTQLNRAQAIILQLEGTLNFEVGGEVAKTLKALYVYARGQMLKSNIENSPRILRALMEKFATVREAWYEADRRPAASAEGSVNHEPAPVTPPATPRRATQYPAAPAAEKSPYGSSPEPELGSWNLSA